MQPVAGPTMDGPAPSLRPDGSLHVADPHSVVVPVPGVPGYYCQCARSPDPESDRTAIIVQLLTQMLENERDILEIAEELSNRYEEIHLMYSISETLGRTISLEDASAIIVREVSSVVGAQRASILVHDPEQSVLRPVAGWGIDVRSFDAVPVDDQRSVAAQAFRECRAIANDSPEYAEGEEVAWPGRSYRGQAFLSVPILYPEPDGAPRPVGVMNLTDRLGADTFSSGHRKLLTAIAHQVGAAIENARLAERDRERQQVRRELELARDLQQRLLPPPKLPDTDIDIAARCDPAKSVGGDFFRVLSLPRSQVGAMLGDVSTHGFQAALIMALVLSAAAIHAATTESPAEALQRLLASVSPELSGTEMYLSLFYGIADESNGCLRYANAGHPHAFRISEDGTAERLGATVPPLGLSDAGHIEEARVRWKAGADVLVLFSDGITEARANAAQGDQETGNASQVFGEKRVLEIVSALRDRSAEEIVDRIMSDVSEFAPTAADDRTILVLKA